MGGGRKNKYFFERIKTLSKIKTENIEILDFNGDFVESRAFGYLAIRRLYNLPISYPSTTGVSKPMIGGSLIEVK